MKVLAISPHADDVELGAGATIARLIDEGASVLHVIVTRGWNRKEIAHASDVLGVNTVQWDFIHRTLPSQRQGVLDELIGLRDTAPDLVFVPTLADVHQDHRVVTEEALRAFKHTTILGYEALWNQVAIPMRLLCLWRVKRVHVERKDHAVKCYTSQGHRVYTRGDLIWALAKLRGMAAGVNYAEAFEVLRWIR